MNSYIAQVVRDPIPGVEVYGGAKGIPTLEGFEWIVNNVISVIILLVGITLFFMTVSGGIGFIVAGGDAKKIDQAKKTITLAVAGFIVIALSFLIIKVIETITGVRVSLFKIYK